MIAYFTKTKRVINKKADLPDPGHGEPTVRTDSTPRPELACKTKRVLKMKGQV